MDMHPAATDGFWQDFAPMPPRRSWRTAYPARMPDGSALWLPLRDLGETAVAGLIANQTSFAVQDRLVGWLAERAAPFGADIVVGLPTLGHAVAPALARALGHPRWAAAGYSRKLWYEERLSVPIASITTPDSRRLWLDPRVLAWLEGRRVLLVDDVLSTGRSIRAGLALLAAAGIRPVAVAALMAQTTRWRAGWDPRLPVVSAFATPLFRRAADGSWVEDEAWTTT
ncbi:MAG: phosphoribosyltransferase [Rhodospirillales bacterium 70-18]|nr:MAG: phosphoribosyltransferase [Rhodospirillales bacterium 70-18]